MTHDNNSTVIYNCVRYNLYSSSTSSSSSAHLCHVLCTQVIVFQSTHATLPYPEKPQRCLHEFFIISVESICRVYLSRKGVIRAPVTLIELIVTSVSPLEMSYVLRRLSGVGTEAVQPQRAKSMTKIKQVGNTYLLGCTVT